MEKRNDIVIRRSRGKPRQKGDTMKYCKWREVRNNEESYCQKNNDVCNNEYWTDKPCENLTDAENEDAEKEE
jgi:hypothetical protein